MACVGLASVTFDTVAEVWLISGELSCEARLASNAVAFCNSARREASGALTVAGVFFFGLFATESRRIATYGALACAIEAGRLGRILQADAYVKWFRSDEYYAPPAKGSWKEEGGGALINQGIHSADLLLWLANRSWHLRRACTMHPALAPRTRGAADRDRSPRGWAPVLRQSLFPC